MNPLALVLTATISLSPLQKANEDYKKMHLALKQCQAEKKVWAPAPDGNAEALKGGLGIGWIIVLTGGALALGAVGGIGLGLALAPH